MLEPNSRQLFPFDAETTYLNHGGFGVTPNDVMDARIRHLKKIEQNPASYVVCECREKWFETARLVARRFAVGEKDVALCDNATDGINAILRSLTFQCGDEILYTSTGYGAIIKALTHIGSRQGAKFVEAHIQFPKPDPQQCLDALKKAITPRTKLAVLDHISAVTALIFPVKEMTKLCHDHGVAVLVDGAHAPGHVAFDINDIDADWYVANLHKWYFAPRACGFLWRSPTRQSKLDILPSVLSWDIDEGFPATFAWTGTRDDSRWLSLPEAFKFMDRFGETQVRGHNHALIREGVSLLSDAWGISSGTPDHMIGGMALVPVPDGFSYPANLEGRQKLKSDFLTQNKIALDPAFDHQGRIWLRVAAQIYNERPDFERLAKVILAMHKPAPS